MRPRLHTTTVRFDWRTWNAILAWGERLGIAHAAFIRDAVIERLARLDHTDQLAQIEKQLDLLTRTLAWIVPIADRAAAKLGAEPAARIETPAGIRERVVIYLPQREAAELRLHAQSTKRSVDDVIRGRVHDLTRAQPGALGPEERDATLKGAA